MAYEIEYEFEELPILRKSGIAAGLVNGIADIDAHSDGEWSIAAIAIEGWRDGKRVMTNVQNIPGTSEGALYITVHSELTSGAFKDVIQDKVDAYNEDRRASFADDFGDHMRKIRASEGI